MSSVALRLIWMTPWESCLDQEAHPDHQFREHGSPVGMAMGTRNSMDFCFIRVRVWVNFKLVSLLMGTKSYPLGLWARFCFYNIRIREPMGFLNPIQHREIVILFVSL